MAPVGQGYYDPAAWNDEQRGKVEALRERVSDVATAWVTPITLLRYLRARSWDVDKAGDMLRATLRWRADFKPEALRWEDVASEAESGKLFILPQKDKLGRHVLVMRPRLENSKSHEGQIRNLVYMLESASQLADQDGSVQLNILQDYQGYGLSNAPPMKTSRETLTILQNHYPERLSVAMLYHAPKLFSIFWKAISPFIDPVTRGKINFIDKGSAGAEAMAAVFDMSQLEADFGGGGAAAFDAVEYAKRMQALDDTRVQCSSQGTE